MATERDEAERTQWRESIADLDPAQFVFVDETSSNTTLTPRFARAPRGERADGTAPRNYQHNTTLVAALTPAGIPAAMTLEGAVNSDAFAAYVEHVLVPTLTPGQIVILDNLSAHKRADIRARIEQAGCTLVYLPAYSPDFNPIEQAFSKLKTLLRRAQARTQEALEAAIATALAAISSHDAVSFYRAGGYYVQSQAL